MTKYFTIPMAALLLALTSCNSGNGPGATASGDSAPPSGSSAEQAPALELAASASSSAGVAPLLVHFNADIASSTDSNRSFHDYEYRWSFGDPASGSWSTSGQSKNEDKGPVATHVFESPGSYTVQLTVWDGSQSVASRSFTITVQDPEQIFASTTTCISPSSLANFTGCPAGANQLVTDDLGNVASLATAGSRVLLQRGASWQLDSAISWAWSDAGPVHIGAYGNCTSPDSQGICSNAPQVTINGDFSFLSLERKQNWRLSDISFTSSSEQAGVLGGAINIRRFLGLRLKSEGFRVPLGWSHWRSSDSDMGQENGLVSCRVNNAYMNGMYVGAERLVLLGNVIANASQSHACRVWQAYLAVISHNQFSGASLDNSAGRHALKLHGPAEDLIGNYSQSGHGGLRFRSRFALVANNVFGSSGPWPVALAPQDSLHDERLSDIIFEKNRLIAQYGGQSVTAVQVSALFSGHYLTVRNNITDGSAAANGYTGLYVWHRGIEPAPHAIHLYHNTIYRNDASSNGNTGIRVVADATATVVQNNLVAFSADSSRETLLQDDSGQAQASHNLLSNSPALMDADNSSPLSRDYSPTSASPALAQGTSVPVFDDFFGNSRGATIDLGACSPRGGG